MAIRKPYAAGSFYPSDPSELKAFAQAGFLPHSELISARAVLLPHAGYLFSGIPICRVLAKISIPEKLILIGPNHNGQGPEFALDASSAWETPLGQVPISRPLVQKFLDEIPDLKEDAGAHANDHALEVLLPLFQWRNPHIEIVPLAVHTTQLEKAARVAQGIADILLTFKEPVLIVISSDLNHYESDLQTRAKDQKVIQAVQMLDSESLRHAVREFHITMCGFVPVWMLLQMSEKLLFKNAELVDYRTSTDAAGDPLRAVGYAGMIIR